MSADVKNHETRIAAVHSVHEFVFSVPDLQQAADFYRHFGLDVRLEDGVLALYTFGHPQRWARIVQGGHKRLLWVTLGIYQQDIDSFVRRLTEAGHACGTPPGASNDGIWLRGPDDLPIQLLVTEKCSPSVKSARVFAPENGLAGRAPVRSAITQVQPSHLSHILVFASDVAANIKFYSEVLGLKLSDHSGDLIAFMHTPHGSDHHLIAFAKSQGYGLHHSSWDVNSFDAIGIGSQQMSKAGYTEGWGLGRHVLGSNYFRYVRDPWGSYAEYSFDIDYIPAGAEWPTADYLAEDSLYVWGPDLPGDFITNYELQEGESGRPAR